jgi:peptidoglycan biosynthesis protein MviN/MurJ (putative lipid II flippase)
MATDTAQDWVSLFLAGLGISFALHEFLGGLFLALALASSLARHRKDQRKLWGALVTAGITAVLAAIAWQWMEWQWLPVQLVMASMGVLGSPGATILVALQDRLEDRSGEVADKAIDHFLPGENRGGDDA